MERDIVDKAFIIRHVDGTYVKLSIFPDKNPGKRMTIGIVVFTEEEFRRFYEGARAYFDGSTWPEWMVEKDMRGLKKANAEFRVKQEQANRSEPLSAEMIQRQNLAAEGRLEPQEIGAVADIVKKKNIEVDI